MSTFTGFCNLNDDLTRPQKIHTLEKITKALIHNATDEDTFYISNSAGFGCKKTKEDQIFTFNYHNSKYTIVYNGRLYNSEELKQDLISQGFDFNSKSDSEVILKAYIHYGPNIFKEFNGVFSFAIWNEEKKEIILVRDHFGIKPLFYTIINNTLVFASEIKSILAYPNFEAILDKQGICEMFGIGPAHTSGTTAFKGIFEIKPAHFSVFNESGFNIYSYWKLETKEHTDSLNKTCSNIKYLLEDSIRRQTKSDIPLCTMLSGGIDSSILVAYISKIYEENGMPPLKTISVDYIDNDKNFVKSDFQPNSDNYYIDIMKNKFNTDHTTVMLDTPELAEYLEDAMIARDMPGMADVDSSLLLFCKNIKNYVSIAISGECSDEIFAGYPWFFREDTLNSKTFPWSIAIDERQKILNPQIGNQINLKNYIDYRYKESINDIEYLPSDSKDTKEKRIISYLTMNWFMQTLLDRADRTSMYNDLEIRVPFCDYRIVEYMWNVPWEMKALNGREKGLLRYIIKDLLPEEIVNRKKSPYPKTHNPNYLKAVKNMLLKIIENPNAPINHLLNKKYILDILNTDGKAFNRPWFGQLMTGPQLIAYLVQVNMWLERYDIKIEI